MPVALLLLLLPQGLGPSVYARDRTFDLQHVKLDIALDPKARLVSGSATLRLAPLNDGLTEVALDSVGLTIEAVTRDRRPLAFRTTAEQLLISLDRAAPAGTPLELEIRYVARPRKGLYFGERYAWSQGFPESQRHWFPVYDFPNDKATSELVVRAPAGWDVVSNGRLIEARDGVYHWLQDKPHSTYLISLAAGEFDRREESFHGIPLRYYVPRGQAVNIPVSFGRTASAMEFFTTRIGPYPWDQFAQVVVPENLYGGMENTSAVTYSPAVLISPELVEDYQVSGDIVIAHELAHQWFGDLVSAEDFRGLWLSEGFATYFANLWSEHRHGADQAAWERFSLARRITDAPAMQKYPLLRRPNDQGDPVGLLAYSKGAWVLHMVRSQLGDTLFWKAIRRYVADYRFQNVRTADLLKAIAAATGRNLEWLFDQYVYEPGHPEFEVRWRWDGRVHVFVRQQARIFRLPVDIELDGRRHRIQVTREAEEFALEAPAKPRLVLFDPDHSLLKKLTFAKETAEWVDQLEHAPRTINRLEAIQALAGGKAKDALERAALTSPSYWVRAEAVRALAAPFPPALADRHPEVRRAALDAINDPKRLLEVARQDASPVTRAAAVEALGRLKPPGALDLLRPFLETASPREMIREAAVAALAGLPGTEPLLLDWSAAGRPVEVRVAALRALSALTKESAPARERLRQAAGDPSLRVRMAAERAGF